MTFKERLRALYYEEVNRVHENWILFDETHDEKYIKVAMFHSRIEKILRRVL